MLGHLPFAAMLKIIGPAMKGSVPADRHDALVAELHKNDPRVIRRHLRSYLRYLDQHGSLASRLCAAGVPAWVLYGEHDDVGITDEERHTLDTCAHVQVLTVPRASHMIANTAPAQVAEILVQALTSAAPPNRAPRMADADGSVSDLDKVDTPDFRRAARPREQLE